MDENITLEEALEKLQQLADKLKSSDQTLDESISCYEEACLYYKKAESLLSEKKQKILIYNPDTDSIGSFDI